MNIQAYITEEVRRQGHDINTSDGQDRIVWMLNAWRLAMVLAKTKPYPEIADIITLAILIEPEKNKNGLRSVGVRVGTRICPRPDEVAGLLKRLWQSIETVKAGNPSVDLALAFYKEFELCHPFVDGNGRTGKILLNWLRGALSDPEFPPADLFGYPIQNP